MNMMTQKFKAVNMLTLRKTQITVAAKVCWFTVRELIGLNMIF